MLPKVEMLDNGWWKVELIKAMHDWAKGKARSDSAMTGNGPKQQYFTGTEGYSPERAYYAGFLGEAIFLNCYRMAELSNRSDFDFEHLGKNIDVKTRLTKIENSLFSANATQSLALRHIKPAIDVFCFISVVEPMEHGYVLGWVTKEDIVGKTIHRKGEFIETKKTRCTTDGFTFSFSELRKPKDLWEFQ